MANYEAAAGQQKPPPFQLPSMGNNQKCNKKQLTDENNESKSSSNSQPSGYYLNVAQKGKLILPTALWILLIIAGICFLTLLASLNRSLNALDELVELEEDKVAKLESIERAQRHQLRHEHDHSHLRHRSFHERHHDERRQPLVAQHKSSDVHHGDGDRLALDLQFSDSNGAETKPSLFDFPFGLLSSLERPSGESGRLVVPPRPFGRRPPVVEQPDVSSTIVITSSMNPGDNMDAAKESGLVDSILKDFMPMLAGPFSGPMRESRPEVETPKEAPSPSGPLISAKIGKINVNINTGDDLKQSEPKKDRKDHHKEQENDASSLESSINSLVGKMMLEDQPSLAGHPRPSPLSPLSSLLGLPHGGPMGSPIMSSLPSSSFVIEQVAGPVPPRTPEDFILGQHNHHHRHSQRLGHGHGHGNDHHHHHHHHRQETRPDNMMPLIIALDGPTGELSSSKPMMSGILPGDDVVVASRPLPSGELFRHGLSNTRRPSFGQSPYELASGPSGQADDNSQLLSLLKQLTGESELKTTKQPTGAPWNALADDLAGSVAQSLFLQDQRPSTAKSEPSSSTPSIFIFGNDKQAGEQKLTTLFPPLDTSNKANDNKSNQIGNLFDLMFGPPPASSLVVAQPEVASQPPKEPTTSSPSMDVKIQPTQPATSSADKSAEPANLTPALQSTVAPSSPADQQSLKSQVDSEDFRKELESVVSSLFTLPQSSGQSNPMRVGGEGTSGGSSSSGSEGSSGGASKGK